MKRPELRRENTVLRTMSDIKDDKPTAEPNADGYYELSPRFTNILEDELQQIMIKVWQALPDEPSSETEKIVVDKFRNEAGDDLRNVLGLNITKRVLNIFNTLYVKVYFSKRPDDNYLKAFIQKCRFKTFKRIEAANTFAAQMGNIRDFDRVCRAKDIKCGGATVKITPCYRFRHCPAKLKTAFSEIDDQKDAAMDTSDSKIDDKELELKQENMLDELTESQEKPKEIVKPKSEDTIKPKVEVKAETKPSPVKKTEEKAKDSGAEAKGTKAINVTQTKQVANKTVIASENVVKKTAASDNSPKKPATSDTVPKKNVPSSENVAKKPVTANENAPKKPVTAAQNVAKKPVISSGNATKPVTASGNAPKKAVAANETVPKKTGSAANAPKKTTSESVPKKTVNASPKEKKIEKAEANDFDELDDHDILALISGGIVLDECTESDEE